MSRRSDGWLALVGVCMFCSESIDLLERDTVPHVPV